MKVRTSSIGLFISVMLLVVFSFTVGLTYKLGIANNYTIGALFLISLFLLYRYSNEGFIITPFNVWAIYMLAVIVLFNNYNLRMAAYIYYFFPVVVIIFYLIAQNSDNWIKVFMNILLGSGVFYAIATIYMMINHDFFYNTVHPLFVDYGSNISLRINFENGYMPGLTPNTGTNAIYLSMALCVSASALFTTKEKKHLYQYVIFLILAIALFSTGKRAHCAFIVLAVVIAYLYVHSNQKFGRFIKVIVLLAVGACVVAIAIEYIQMISIIMNSWIDRFNSGNFDTGRGVLRESALELFRSHPFFGIGWEGFKYIHSDGSAVHNVYIQLLCEAGVLGAIAFYVFFVMSLFRTIQSARKYAFTDCKNEKRHIFFSITTQVFFLLYCLTGNPLYDWPSLLTYFCACAIGEYYYKKSKRGAYESSNYDISHSA